MKDDQSEKAESEVTFRQKRSEDAIAGVVQQQEQRDQIDEAVMNKIQDLHEEMTKQGMHKAADLLEGCFSPPDGRAKKRLKWSTHSASEGRRGLEQDKSTNQNRRVVQYCESVETIYDNAIEKRLSSSDDNLDTSDKTNNNEFSFNSDRGSTGRGDQVRPSTSKFRDDHMVASNKPVPEETPEEVAAESIRRAEAKKAQIFPTTGESQSQVEPFISVVKIDQDYQLVGSHIDQTTRDKIARGEYVDFSHLLPKDRILAEEDERLELIVKQGRAYWSPVADTVAISSYNRWEQAFRIYSDIFMRHQPHRSSELVQYNHVIHSISTTYVWDNVYAYDKEFRLHVSKHPERSWAVILQQAWSMRLKDRIYNNNHSNNSSNSGNGGFSPGYRSENNGNGNGKTKSDEACKRFNRGFCKFGSTCKFDHKCLFCGKFGHTILTCRKLAALKDKGHKNREHKQHKMD